MMTLNTLSEKRTDSEARIFWRTGTTKKGILDVKLDFEHEDAALIAELIALQYLLFEKKVFNREPGSGNGYKLVVSKGAIKKLALGKSNKKHAVKFAAFLTNRMKGVAIEVSQSRDLMATPEEQAPEVLHGNREVYARTFDPVETPAMGTILVTQHAVDRYQERITSGDPKKPWASLVGRLMHPELRKIDPGKRVLAHKARKYGDDNKTEYWSHPTSSFVYQVLRESSGAGILVTVYERRDD